MSNKATRRFAVKVFGSNARRASAWTDSVTLGADGSAEGSYIEVLDQNEQAQGVALFDSQEKAREAAYACRWNNQTFRIVVARGQARESGILVEEQEWKSCQSF